MSEKLRRFVTYAFLLFLIVSPVLVYAIWVLGKWYCVYATSLNEDRVLVYVVPCSEKSSRDTVFELLGRAGRYALILENVTIDDVAAGVGNMTINGTPVRIVQEGEGNRCGVDRVFIVEPAGTIR